MTKRDLLHALKGQAMDSHVIIALLPADLMPAVVPVSGITLEIDNVQLDNHGRINIVAVAPCSTVDKTIRR